MPDPWLTDEELDQFNKDVENHPLTKQAEEAKSNAEDLAEEKRKQDAENQKKVEEGELVEVRANGAVVGYRDASQVEDAELQQAFAEGVKPAEDSQGGEVTGGTAKLQEALKNDEEKNDDSSDDKSSSSKK